MDYYSNYIFNLQYALLKRYFLFLSLYNCTHLIHKKNFLTQYIIASNQYTWKKCTSSVRNLNFIALCYCIKFIRLKKSNVKTLSATSHCNTMSKLHIILYTFYSIVLTYETTLIILQYFITSKFVHLGNYPSYTHLSVTQYCKTTVNRKKVTRSNQ